MKDLTIKKTLSTLLFQRLFEYPTQGEDLAAIF